MGSAISSQINATQRRLAETPKGFQGSLRSYSKLVKGKTKGAGFGKTQLASAVKTTFKIAASVALCIPALAIFGIASGVSYFSHREVKKVEEQTPSAHKTAKINIQNERIKNLKAQITTSGILGLDGEKLTGVAKKAYKLAKEVNEIDTTKYSTSDFDKLHNKFVSLFEKVKLNDRSVKQIKDFLNGCIKALFYTDTSQIIKDSAKDSLKLENEDYKTSIPTIMKRRQKAAYIRDDWWKTTVWGLSHILKGVHSFVSGFSGLYQARMGNPTYVAYKISGTEIVSGPTPSGGDEAFKKGVPEYLKSIGKRQIHYNYQSTHLPDDLDKIREIEEMASKNRGVYDQVVFDFDAIKSTEGKNLVSDFEDIPDFFKRYKGWALGKNCFGMRSLGADRPIYIPVNLLNDSQIDSAFMTAEKMCKALYGDLPESTKGERTHKATLMHLCICQVLQYAIMENNSEFNSMGENKLIISNACRQHADRGPTMAKMQAMLHMLRNNYRETNRLQQKPLSSLTSVQKRELIEIFYGLDQRAPIIEDREALERRLKFADKMFEAIDQHGSQLPKILHDGLLDIQSRKTPAFSPHSHASGG